MEELRRKHRSEQRDLQARITQRKKNATKKTRKGVNDDCEQLEHQLKERQAAEVAALSSDTEQNEHEDGLHPQPSEELPNEHEQANGISTQPNSNDTSAGNAPQPSANQAQAKKPSRQKARLARRAAEQEAAASAAAEEAANQPDRRADEHKMMEEQLKARGLVEKEVRSDGHCMYAAVADQLQQSGVELHCGGLAEYMAVRRDAANFIQSHPDDFAPFLEEPLEEYVVKVRDTGEWGGQLELSALSKVYGLVVNVLQGDGRIEKIEPGTTSEKEVWLAYYRHSFGLGEHYNSLRKAP